MTHHSTISITKLPDRDQDPILPRRNIHPLLEGAKGPQDDRYITERSAAMQRRFSGLFTALVLLTLVLTACGGGGTTPTTPSKVTVNWWHISTTDPGKTDLQNIANQYMKAHPNVIIKITILENDAFKSKLTTVMQSGKPPDLFHSWGGGVMAQYAEAGLLKDITPQLQGDWGNSFNQSALNVYGANGKYYGVPWDMGAVGFWYNKAIFTKL